MYSRLLVPLDGSPLAEAVFPIVERLAAAYGAAVVLLHILERDPPPSVHGERHLTTTGEAERYLRAVAFRLEQQGTQVEYHTHTAPEGDVAHSIVDHVDEEQIDLIVLCAHGRGGMRDLFFGSIAQQVLRRGTTPVLFVRALPESAPIAFSPATVLVPLDGTGVAEAALPPAADLATRLGVRLRVVMVVPTVSTIRGNRAATAVRLPRTTEALLETERDEAEIYLHGVATSLESASLQVMSSVVRGETVAALAATAAEPGVGLLVVATHGRSGLQAVWSRSIAAQLLSRSKVPILLLRSRE